VGPESIRVVDARPGTGVDRKALRRSLRTLPGRVELRVVAVRPVVSTGEAQAAANEMEVLLDGPRRVRFRDAEALLTPERLRALLRTRRADGDLAVSLAGDGLGASLRVRLGRFEYTPGDATFAIGPSGVRVVPSRPGKALDVDRIGRSLVSNLASTTHLARFIATKAALTTEAAEKLDIREKISEFTTYYSCCQPRVTNIQRAAQILDGTIVRPGDAFSLNKALGKRTVEKGFVAAPQIFDGRLEDAVGGGISQVATTLYNAAFFAGVKLVAHQAHQFYISRYPMGREATVSWGGPELIFQNDWPAAILVKVAASESAITVRFYSRKLRRRVETTTGEPYAVTPPRTIRTLNSALPPGTTSTVQSSGASGFTVQYTRRVFKGETLVNNERFTVRYDPQHAIVEVAPKTAPKRPVAPRTGPKPPVQTGQDEAPTSTTG
jgi:vancomycin resistance protein YoaR